MNAQTSTVGPIWAMAALVLVFTVKHFVADFLFQTNWIATGKERPHRWVAPLAVHVAGHAVLALLITLAVAPRLWWLALVDFVIHFAVDRGKSVVSRALGCTLQDVRFWWLLGFDQFLHQVTNVGLSAALLVL